MREKQSNGDRAMSGNLHLAPAVSLTTYVALDKSLNIYSKA